MTFEEADAFAAEWLTAWNSHDLEAILSHYDDDFEMNSPVILELMGGTTGKLVGKAAVGAYWKKGLERFPNLHFEKLHVLRGVNSVTIVYNGVRGPSAEVFHFGTSGLVVASHAHYVAETPS